MAFGEKLMPDGAGSLRLASSIWSNNEYNIEYFAGIFLFPINYLLFCSGKSNYAFIGKENEANYPQHAEMIY